MNIVARDPHDFMMSGAKFRKGHKATVVGVLGDQAPPVYSRGHLFYNRDRWTLRGFVSEMCKWAAENPQCIPTPGVIRAWIQASNNHPIPIREIVIANTPDELTVSTARALMGGAYHEAFHTKYSCRRPLRLDEMLQMIIPRWAKVPDWSKFHGLLQTWNNIIEDIRIERRGQEKYPGSYEKLHDLQDLILSMEKDPKFVGGRSHGDKPQRGALSLIMCTFRDMGLGYDTPLQREALAAYRKEDERAVDFVIGQGKDNPGPLTPLLREAVALSDRDDTGCVRIAMDVIGVLYQNMKVEDPANDPQNKEHQPGASQKPQCPQCGAPGSKLVIRPKANGNGGKVQGIGILTCVQCGHQEEVPLQNSSQGQGQPLDPNDTPKFEGFDKQDPKDAGKAKKDAGKDAGKAKKDPKDGADQDTDPPSGSDGGNEEGAGADKESDKDGNKSKDSGKKSAKKDGEEGDDAAGGGGSDDAKGDEGDGEGSKGDGKGSNDAEGKADSGSAGNDKTDAGDAKDAGSGKDQGAEGEGSGKDQGAEGEGSGKADGEGGDKKGKGADGGNSAGGDPEAATGSDYRPPSEDPRDEGYKTGDNKSHTDADEDLSTAPGGGHKFTDGPVAGNDWSDLMNAAMKGKPEPKMLDNNSALGGAVATDMAKEEKAKGLQRGEAAWKPFYPEGDTIQTVLPSGMGIDHDRTLADQLYASVRDEASYLRSRFRQIMRALEMTSTFHGARKGRALSGRFLVDSKVTLMGGERPHRAYKTRDEQIDTSMAAAVVIDESGSMKGRLRHATQALCAITEPLDGLGCPVQVSGIRDGGSRGCNADIQPGYHRYSGVHHDIFKEFHEPLRAVRWRFANTRADGGTPLADGIQFGLNALSTRNEGHRILFVITDGQPNGGHMPIIKRQCRLAREAGIIIVPVGIGHGAEYVKDISDDYVWSPDIATLPVALINKLNNIVDLRLNKRGVRYTG